jgi:hypothetical protein
MIKIRNILNNGKVRLYVRGFWKKGKEMGNGSVEEEK